MQQCTGSAAVPAHRCYRKSLEMQHAALFLVALIACAHAVSAPLPRIVRISGQSFVTTATQVCLIETGN
jgi:hypothetical protein